MIVILYQPSCQKIAEKAEADLLAAFAGHVKIELIPAISAISWPLDASWDDLLLVLYDGKDFPATGNLFIEEYLRQRPDKVALLPVAVDPNFSKPPEAAAAIKALQYDLAAQGQNGRLANRVGAMLGLRLQGRESKIFISYRATDGSAIADQLYAHLEGLGHQPWLDVAKELDGETKILPGSPVQDEIDKALSDASLVLLLDTPAASFSPWIMHEVDTADAMLLPILPICFRESGNSKIGSRFRSLHALQRCVSIQSPTMAATSPLDKNQLNMIVYEAEKYLCEIFQRKCRVPFIVKKEFVSKGFDWIELKNCLQMFEASKTKGRKTTNVLSHCSIFDQIYDPAITRFLKFISQEEKYPNHSLFIYDGELISDIQLAELSKNKTDPVNILHHQELRTFIDSDFTALGTT